MNDAYRFDDPNQMMSAIINNLNESMDPMNEAATPKLPRITPSMRTAWSHGISPYDGMFTEKEIKDLIAKTEKEIKNAQDKITVLQRRYGGPEGGGAPFGAPREYDDEYERLDTLIDQRYTRIDMLKAAKPKMSESLGTSMNESMLRKFSYGEYQEYDVPELPDDEAQIYREKYFSVILCGKEHDESKCSIDVYVLDGKSKEAVAYFSRTMKYNNSATTEAEKVIKALKGSKSAKDAADTMENMSGFNSGWNDLTESMSMNEARGRSPVIIGMMDQIDYMVSGHAGIAGDEVEAILDRHNANDDDSGEEGYFSGMSDKDIRDSWNEIKATLQKKLDGGADIDSKAIQYFGVKIKKTSVKDKYNKMSRTDTAYADGYCDAIDDVISAYGIKL